MVHIVFEPYFVIFSYIPISLLVYVKEAHIVPFYFTNSFVIFEDFTIEVVLFLGVVCTKLIVCVQLVCFIFEFDFAY